MPHVARAQAYPTRPVRVILPFAAGGVADVTSRLAADKLGEKLGQRFVIENMAGPGGIAAARAMIIGRARRLHARSHHQRHRDQRRDLQAVSVRSGEGSRADLRRSAISSWCSPPMRTRPTRRWPICIKAARAQPGKLNIGTIAVGSTQHLGAELFRSSAKLDIQLIPYKTTPDVIVGLIRNDIQVMIDFYAAMRAGLVRQEAAAARDLRPQAHGVPAGRAAGRRGRRARLRGAVLERPRRAGRHAAADHRHAEQGDPRGARDAGRDQALPGGRHRRAAPARRTSCAGGWSPTSRSGPR